MRFHRLLPLASCLFLLVGVATPAQQRDASQNGWSDFEVGSWVVIRDSSKVRVKHQIMAFDNDHAHVNELPEVDGKFVDKQSIAYHSDCPLPHQFATAVGKPRKETVQIGGKKIECTVHELTKSSEDPKYTAKFVIWRATNVKVPYRKVPNDRQLEIALTPDTVKSTLHFDAGSDTSTYTMVVEDFDRKLKIGKKEVSCVVEKWSIDEKYSDHKATLEIVTWLSDAVPGCEVKVLVKCQYMGEQLESEKAVVDFKAEKKK